MSRYAVEGWLHYAKQRQESSNSNSNAEGGFDRNENPTNDLAHATTSANESETNNFSSYLDQIILLAPCGPEETLPLDPKYPADIFTACLTTPIKIAMRLSELCIFRIYVCALLYIIFLPNYSSDGVGQITDLRMSQMLFSTVFQV